MSPKKILDKFIRENISAFMKESGFSKLGKTWTKQNGDNTYIVNIQSNKWNASDVPVEVFINYGIYSPESYKKHFKLSALPKHPKEYDCYIRKRLISSDNKSETWTIGLDGYETSKVGIVNSIRKDIFTFFDAS